MGQLGTGFFTHRTGATCAMRSKHRSVMTIGGLLESKLGHGHNCDGNPWHNLMLDTGDPRERVGLQRGPLLLMAGDPVSKAVIIAPTGPSLWVTL